MTSGADAQPVTVDWHKAWLSFRAPEDPAVLAAWLKLSRRFTVSGEAEEAIAAREALTEGFACLDVNARPEVRTEPRITSLQVFADRLRRYGIRVGIAVNFGSPLALGGLKTADPLDRSVQDWWTERAMRLYGAVPDLIGLLVKANSEGQPGPQDYGRDHVDGANMLANALRPHGGIVYWRAFVYRWNPAGRPSGDGHDSLRDSSDTFARLDGRFSDNVVVVIKNGPLDFQVREPVHPLFGLMTRTRCLLGFQVTQEYTGQDVHFCYLPRQWGHYLSEPIDSSRRLSDRVKRSSSAAAADGGLIGVSAWGDSECWSGHPLAQVNLYGVGRLAWNPDESPEIIARDWTAQTFGTRPHVIKTITRILLSSWEVYESYTSPLGLGMMHCKARHLDPAPQEREYAHCADANGIGRDRTVGSGSGFAGLYEEPMRRRYETPDQTDENLMLMFHRVGWDERLPSGFTVWETLQGRYLSGVSGVAEMRRLWDELSEELDPTLHREVSSRFASQLEHAPTWARTMLGYFNARREGP